jgi:hypothetical protein
MMMRMMAVIQAIFPVSRLVVMVVNVMTTTLHTALGCRSLTSQLHNLLCLNDGECFSSPSGCELFKLDSLQVAAYELLRVKLVDEAVTRGYCSSVSAHKCCCSCYCIAAAAAATAPL